MLCVSEISKKYKKKIILQNVSFQAKAGEMVALVGENGSGKSTLLNILSGVVRPSSGVIYCFGQRMERRRMFAKYCGYVPQSNGLMEELSVQDNISLWTGRSGKPDDRLIRMLQLEDILQMPVVKLSGGMKRRVAVACAVANFPPILLLDEPTAALDVKHKEQLYQIMRDYLSMNGILVVATHEEREIAMADQIVAFENGYLAE